MAYAVLTSGESGADSLTDINANFALAAPLASPTFTGTPSLPTGTTATTQSTGDSSTKLATTAFVQQDKIGYVLGGGQSRAGPADATTYYFGATSGVQAATNQGTYHRWYVPRAGTVKAVYCWFYNYGTAGSAETSTVSLRLNSTSDTTISSSVVNDQASDAGALFSNTSMSLAVAAGDFLEIKWVTPTWATNPSEMGIITTIYIE